MWIDCDALATVVRKFHSLCFRHNMRRTCNMNMCVNMWSVISNPQNPALSLIHIKISRGKWILRIWCSIFQMFFEFHLHILFILYPPEHGTSQYRHTHTHTHIHTHTHTHTHICIYVHTYTYTHTYTCIHTHTHSRSTHLLDRTSLCAMAFRTSRTPAVKRVIVTLDYITLH